jgi:hypothetical protein
VTIDTRTPVGTILWRIANAQCQFMMQLHREPKVVYLGPREYRTLMRELHSDAETIVNGMRIVVKNWPGVIVA